MNKIPARTQAGRTVIRAVGGAGHLVAAELDAALGLHGLSIAKLSVLRHLAQAKEPLALGQLAERLACVRSNITQLVDRLEADGLVQRTPDPHDRRSLRASITQAGRRRYKLGTRAEAEAEAKLVRGLTPNEQSQLARLLAKLKRGEGGR
ncbi:MAG: MarR family transcriptional regulator [Anaerolineales bacterium]|jgi:DNA-binding MarR family transcriptional regulator